MPSRRPHHVFRRQLQNSHRLEYWVELPGAVILLRRPETPIISLGITSRILAYSSASPILPIFSPRDSAHFLFVSIFPFIRICTLPNPSTHTSSVRKSQRSKPSCIALQTRCIVSLSSLPKLSNTQHKRPVFPILRASERRPASPPPFLYKYPLSS